MSIDPRSGKRFAEQLQERLLVFAAAVCTRAKQAPRDRATDHIIEQLVRSAASPAANYAEACAAQSRRDFIHKMGICLKELRETQVWLALQRRTSELGDLADLETECNELTAIFVSSINTARRGLTGH